MKVKASWKLIGLNPFKLEFGEKDMYFKTVEVPDDTNMAQLEFFAREDTKKGYEFIKLEVLK